MPRESYFEQLSKLKNEMISTRGEVFDFSGSPESSIFEYVYVFFKESIEFNRDRYKIPHPFLIFSNDYELNGFAYVSNDVPIIEITRGIVNTYFDIYWNGQAILDKHKSFFKNFDVVGIPLIQMLHIDSLTFLVHHELAHLLQRNKDYTEFSNDELSTKSENEILERHAQEYDADIFGSTVLVLYMLKRFDDKKVNQDGHSDLLSSILTVGIISILVTFSFFNAKNTDLYLVEKKHPHPIVRTDYVLMNIIRLLETNSSKLPRIELGKIVQNSILVANELIAMANNENGTRFFNFEFSELASIYGSDNVKQYKEKLTSIAMGMPNLTINGYLSPKEPSV